MDRPAVLKNKMECQERLTEQYLKDRLTYRPMKTGKFLQAGRKVYYAESILTSAA